MPRSSQYSTMSLADRLMHLWFILYSSHTVQFWPFTNINMHLCRTMHCNGESNMNIWNFREGVILLKFYCNSIKTPGWKSQKFRQLIKCIPYESYAYMGGEGLEMRITWEPPRAPMTYSIHTISQDIPRPCHTQVNKLARHGDIFCQVKSTECHHRFTQVKKTLLFT